VIYDPPIFRPLGDRYLGVEFGDEANLALNFKVLALEDRLLEAGVRGIVDVIPSLRQLAVVLDPDTTTHVKIEAALKELIDDLGEVRSLPSRRLRLPCWYDDPWGAELARRYGVQKNIEFVADQNGITVGEVIERHTGTDFWVVCVGFTPGCYFSFPLEPSQRLVAPKWVTPRDYTPARMLALAGFSTGAYPVASPGGYQLVGRLAVNIYEPVPRNRIFPPDGVLLRAGDRIRYFNVDALEYDEIWSAVEAGDYDYDVVEETFDVAAYLGRSAEAVARALE
jgi:KipI family sensor histidine kinase inhibitor